MAETLTQTSTSVPTAVDGLPSAPDLDQLLDDAESLAQEIADAVTLDADPPAQADAAQSLTLPQEPALLPAQATVPDPVETQSPADEATASALVEDQPEPPATAESPATATLTEDPPPPLDQTQSPSPLAEPAPEPQTPAIAASDQTLAPAPEPSANESIATVEPQRTSLARRLVAAAGWTAMLPARILFGILAVIDLPFAGLSPATKNKIGVVGLATLIMAAAAYFLPAMLKSNPYEHITDFPPAAVEEGHEGGGEHAKPAAEHEKPAPKSSGGHH